jgi:hypothetical protein
MTDHQQLTALLAQAQKLAHAMSKSGVWDDLIHTTAESIDAAVLELEGTYVLTDDERAVRARDDADDWKFERSREERESA